jgi:hypothetical protein
MSRRLFSMASAIVVLFHLVHPSTSLVHHSNHHHHHAFASQCRRRSTTTTNDSRLQAISREEEEPSDFPTRRRNVLQSFPYLLASFVWSQSVRGSNTAAHAAVMDNNSQKVFEVGKVLTIEQAKERLQEGQTSLSYLLDHFDEICEKGGGDNVRRYLGTVGMSSGLFGIQKVMKLLQTEADDIVDYTETMNDINAAINGADGSAYMAIFVSSSSSSTPPQRYFDDAKIEVKRAVQSMKDLVEQLDIK